MHTVTLATQVLGQQGVAVERLLEGSDIAGSDLDNPARLICHAQELQVLANALAQTQALMVGKASDDGQRHFPGNRPSTLMLLESLNPASLGALIALQEHRVFVSGSLWGINSFDQWGVELGKQLAKTILAELTGETPVQPHDSSTEHLVRLYRNANCDKDGAC